MSLYYSIKMEVKKLNNVVVGENCVYPWCFEIEGLPNFIICKFTCYLLLDPRVLMFVE